MSLEKPGNALVGFHARRLEVAELHPAMSQLMSLSFSNSQQDSSLPNPSAETFKQLQQWEQEPTEVRHLPSPNLGRVRSITLNVTQICNLHCTYCAAGGDGTFGSPVQKMSLEKTLPQLMQYLEKLEEGDLFHINFLGGEPLLYPEAVNAVAQFVDERARTKKFLAKFVITTNGTLITDRVIEILCKHQMHVNVSIDGPATINDRVRPGKSGQGVTERVLAGLKKLSGCKSQLSSLGVTGVFDRNNLFLDEAYGLYRDLNVDWYEFNFSHTETDLAASKVFAEKFEFLIDAAFAWGGEAEVRKFRFYDLLFSQLDEQIQSENFCGAGKSLIMIDAKNDVYPCPWMVGDHDEKLGEGTYLSETRLAKLMKPLIELNDCRECWARFVCGGGCMYIHKHTTGSKHQKSEAFCERTRQGIAAGIVLYFRSRKSENGIGSPILKETVSGN